MYYKLPGKDVDDDQPERMRRSLKIYAPLRAEMEHYRRMTAAPHEEDFAHVKSRKFSRRAIIR